jgi:tetrahydromethanopterin S-methyltransferase subunit F
MFIAKSKCVNISLGSNTEMIDSNVELIRKRDIAGRIEFVEKKP